MIEALADVFRAYRSAGAATTPEDVADALWLARWLPAAPDEIEPVAPRTEGAKPDDLPEDLSTEKPIPEPKPSEAADRPDEAPGAGTGSVGLSLPPLAGQGGGVSGRTFWAPGAPALARPLEIARALRPLARRVPSRVRFVLDETETIRRFAEERVCDPAQRPDRERWLRLALVTDTGAGADLWRDTAREFRSLLGSLGAFRDVRTWSLDTDSGPPRLVPGERSNPDTAPRHPKELLDPGGRTLVIVLSPCIAAGWHDGTAADVLALWARHGPVALVPLLPEYMWSRTALAKGCMVRATAPAPGTANGRLRSELIDAWPGEEVPPGVPLPVAVLEPAALRRWVGLVVGRSAANAPAIIFDSAADTVAPVAPVEPPSALARVEQFWRTASPLARRLAGLLAAAPVVNLPILRLVRQSMLPAAGQPHEAEVLFGGLLARAAGGNETDPRFVFVPGAREALLDAAPTDESLSVLEAVSDYLGEHLASGRTFKSVFADPASASGELATDDSPFARIAAEVLVRAGGDFARLVRRAARPDPQPARGTTDSQQSFVRRPRPPTEPDCDDASADSGPAPKRPAGELLGERASCAFGRYTLTRRIGAGSVGVVFEAHDPALARTVALKVPRAGAECDAVTRVMFREEFHLGAQLNELTARNIAPVFDAGEVDGCPFFTMEYLTGERIDAYWERERERLGPAGLADLIHRFARILERVHRSTYRGPTIHGNLKPGNLFVCPAPGEAEPRLVVLDFGLGPVFDAAHPPSPGEWGFAAFGYLPPEQLVPGWQGNTITERSDVYSLGAVLYELITGRLPFETGTWNGLVAAALNEPIPLPSSLNPAFRLFNQICLKAMARNPADRYASMSEFDDALTSWYLNSRWPYARGEEPAAPPIEPIKAAAPPHNDRFANLPCEFGPYRLVNLRQVAEKGRYLVFDARDAREQMVAVTVLHADADPARQQGFRDEIWLSNRLSESGLRSVPRFFDTDAIDGYEYFAAELLHGQRLEAYWEAEREQLGRTGLAELIGRVAREMAAVHRALAPRTLIHRNLNPRTILVVPGAAGEEPRLVILGFALALVTGDAKTRALGYTGGIVGAFGYMPPEQMVPGWEGVEITPRADVYSLGTVLYQLLTGERPFAGDTTAELTTAVLNTDFRPPGELDSRYAAFDPVCRKALARHPNDRYATMDEFADALDALGRPGAFAPRPAPVAEPVEEPAPPPARPRRRRLEVETIGDVACVTFVDKNSFHDHHLLLVLRDDLYQLVDELGHRKVIINFSNAEFITKKLLGVLITLHRKLQAVQGKLVLCSISKNILEVFQITKLDKVLTIAPTEQEALQRF